MMNPEPNNAANRPSQTEATNDSPWWMKHVTRFVGTASGIAALVLGVFACITLSPTCLLAGIIQMICAVAVLLVEAPCFCMFLDFAQVPSAFFDRKPLWYRGILYVVLSIFPLVLCRQFSTFFGSGFIFVTGCLYGVMALGKKAPLAEMRAKASSSYNLLPKQHGDIESGPPPSETDPKKPANVF